MVEYKNRHTNLFAHGDTSITTTYSNYVVTILES